MVNVFELVACNIEDTINEVPIEKFPEIVVFPNPSKDRLTLVTPQEISLENVSVLNLIGQKVDARVLKVNTNKLEIDLFGNVPGVYFIRLKTNNGFVAKKVSFVPW